MPIVYLERNLALTALPETRLAAQCMAPFDPATGLLNLRKRHSWRDGEGRQRTHCRLCGRSWEEAHGQKGVRRAQIPGPVLVWEAAR